MGALGALAFGAPWILAALAALPVIWWLLRVTPPAPRAQDFPAIRLLYDLRRREETPQRTPWWLLLLRLVLAALVILALSRPVLDPGEALPGSGSVVIAVDDGWAAARDWPARRTAMLDAIDRAERAGRTVILLPTSAAADGAPPALSGVLRPAEARGRVEAMVPRSWPVNRQAAADALEDPEAAAALEQAGFALWLTDGLAGPGTQALAERLRGTGGLRVLAPEDLATARLMEPPAAEGAGLVVPVHRATAGGAETLEVRLSGPGGRLLGSRPAAFEVEATTAEARFDLPVELRNEAARIDLAGQTTAGATVLLDDRWRRRPVGILSESAEVAAQPLLSATYYLDRALAPYSAVRAGGLDDLLDPTAGGLAALLLPDIGTPLPADREALERFMEAGGVVVRFAGPLMAANPDTLVPVPLRFGDRALTGALTWSEPQPLAPFPPESPFYGLSIPDDVIVRRQVLAEPTVDLASKTWARLADGTPLITAEPRGEGHLVLVHTTAGPDWSTLPLSGLFVQMLRRVAALGAGVEGGEGARALAPVRVLDGFGRTRAPSAGVEPIPAGALADLVPGPRHPPGWYGTEDSRRAVNLGDRIERPAPLGALPPGVQRLGYGGTGATALAPWLLAAAMALTVIDLAIALALRGWAGGRLRPTRRAATAAGA
ncbi:MAG: BatA domain-containing protein, partial [Azospirillaceae bacterium]